ncbi:MAG: glycerol-3-phosphate acyltransferase [Alphaproteobacteria bacterium]|jgi:glycerol-3-phosphate O-acyltransferase|nr:glycerol-3-phosphate acyltransferase [Alphaproteobacteria bacterium]
MDEPVSVPLWLFIPIALFAAWSLFDRLVIPSGRWIVRRRLNRLIEQVNRRLQIGIQPFQLTKRQVLIDRLIYDPDIVAAANAHAAEQKIPREAALSEVYRYAHEIVPAFNAYIYFRIGYALARALARSFYRVRLGWMDAEGLSKVSPDSTVVFVMNHRSNMDYVLVAFLAADRTALSYAVGEWARIWPLQSLIKSMGAYFVRRNSNNPLYRKVLERYVHMATEAGVAQAVYPEGGLTRDGTLSAPRTGLLDYMLKSFDPHGKRDVVFVPVGINYDRVVEDRSQLLAAQKAPRKGAVFATRKTLGFFARQFWLLLRGRWFRFGYACVNFGTPLSTREWMARTLHGDLRGLTREERFEAVQHLANDLMGAVASVVPVLPVPLMARVLLQASAPLSLLELKAECQEEMERLRAAGAHVYLPRGDEDYAIEVGLRMLALRHLVEENDGVFAIVPAEADLLRYYANSITHLR